MLRVKFGAWKRLNRKNETAFSALPEVQKTGKSGSPQLCRGNHCEHECLFVSDSGGQTSTGLAALTI